MDMNGKAKIDYSSETEEGSRVKFASSHPERRSVCCARRTTLELVLIVVCVVCLIVSIAMIILEAKRSGTNDSNNQLCLTQDCVRAASALLEGMNQEVDPCDNFFEYACGSWNKVNVIPDDRSSYNTFAKLRDDLQSTLKDLLEHPVSDDDIEATKKAKYLYQSCVNETLIDERDIKPVQEFIEQLGGWPVADTNNTWSADKFDLIELLVKLRHYNNKILVDQWVSADDKNSEVNIIQLDQPDLGMPSRDYFLKGRDDQAVKVYEEFAVNVAVVFGANRTAAVEEMADMIDLEIHLANITIPRDQRRDNEKIYNKWTIEKLNHMIPGFNWSGYLTKIFEPVNITINETEEVVIYAPDYLQNMVKIVNQTSSRTLANYLVWRIMMNRVTNLPEKYRNLRKEYNKIIFGSQSERSRWRDCVTYVNDNMGNAVGRMFVKDHFDEDSKNKALVMIHDIRDAFNTMLNEVNWLDEPTRKVAKEKADAIAEKIGYPPFIVNETAINMRYRYNDYKPDKYFENVLENIRNIALGNAERLREPVDRTQWSTTPAVVNAFYSSTKNQIMFPAGILQPPFYSKGYPKALNYGGIGAVIAHEQTHAFDDQGRQFDKNGNLKQWWDDEVIKRFKEKAQCIVDQYSNFTVPDVNLNLNGIQTQGENIADNGGLKQAYRAYMKRLDGKSIHEGILPGLTHLSHQHLFFLNFAQVWCGSIRPEAAVNRVRTGLHSPGRFRVIGTLQNMKEFSDVYKCPKGSYMNPEVKCSIW